MYYKFLNIKTTQCYYVIIDGITFTENSDTRLY